MGVRKLLGDPSVPCRLADAGHGLVEFQAGDWSGPLFAMTWVSCPVLPG